MVATDGRGDATRKALIRAAEVLMAEHGIDGVDLNEVQQLAGARNRSAIQYHFRNRDGLVAAVLLEHRRTVNATRLRMLDRLVRTDNVTPETLVDALIVPLAEHLKTPSGQNYILVSAQRTPFYGWQRLLEGTIPAMDGVHRWVELVLPRLSGTAEDRRLRIGTTVLVLTDSLVDLARALKAGDITYRQARHRARHVRDYMARGLFGENNPESFQV
jgi:AcrR family transcriptional regulator